MISTCEKRDQYVLAEVLSEEESEEARYRNVRNLADDMRRLAPLQRAGGPESPRAAGPVMPHLAHNYDFGWRQPDRLPTTEAFYGSGWSSPRAFEIEHVVSRAAHPHLPSHGPRPTLLGARAISLSTHKREHVHLADDRARNAYLRPHTALRRLGAAAAATRSGAPFWQRRGLFLCEF